MACWLGWLIAFLSNNRVPYNRKLFLFGEISGLFKQAVSFTHYNKGNGHLDISHDKICDLNRQARGLAMIDGDIMLNNSNVPSLRFEPMTLHSSLFEP